MAVRSLAQTSFFDPEFVKPGCLVPGTTPWLLARHRSRLFPRWLWSGWRGEKRLGRKAWPARVLLTLLHLRWTETGMSRVASVRRAANDVVWRAALGLPFDTGTPDEKTVRDFERFMRRRHPDCNVPRYLLLHEHVARLCLENGVVDDNPQWVMDSTPMWCFGATRGTVRLLGDGLTSLAKQWARATRSTLAAIARKWDVPHVNEPSTKGAFSIDWKDADQRANVVDALASAAVRCSESVMSELRHGRKSFHKALLRKCRALLKIVKDDLELDEQGRRVVAQRVHRDRLVSFTDPMARHGRKSKSSTFKGFKLHLLGDAVSGLIASVVVTPGDRHDGSVADRLVARAQRLSTDITRFLGDTAYGGAALRKRMKRAGYTLIAPPPPTDFKRTTKFFRRHEFDVDFAALTATCPAGVTTAQTEMKWSKSVGAHTRRFRWPLASCQACPLKPQCNDRKRTGHLVELHPQEQTQREAREEWKTKEIQLAYRRRAEGERLVRQMTRHGARDAAAWGIQAAHQQAHAIATECNLALLARALQ